MDADDEQRTNFIKSFYIYVYMQQEIKQWTNRKTYAKMDKKEGCTVKRGLLADRLKGMRAFWCCSAMCSAACAQQTSPPPPFSSASNGFVELSHRPFHGPLRLCLPHHGRRDGKGQPSALYSVLASVSTAAAAASFMPPRSVTVGSTKVRFLLFSNMRCMVFAAVGAHAPFSMKATVRF